MALAVLVLSTYVFVTSCTRAGQREQPAAAPVTPQAPPAAAPAPAPAATTDYLPETKAAKMEIVAPPADNAQPRRLPADYMPLSTTKSGIMHIIPRTPSSKPAPVPTAAAAQQQNAR